MTAKVKVIVMTSIMFGGCAMLASSGERD